MQHIPKLRIFSLILGVSGLLALLACNIGPMTPPGINQDPTANAGADQTVEVSERVELNGLGSTDPDDDPLTYIWEQRFGPNVTLDNPNSAQASFLPVEDGFYEFALTVTDGRGGSDTSTVRVFVGDVDPSTCPRADAGVDQTVNEGAAVTLRGGNSVDPSGVPLTYEWYQVSGEQVSINGVFLTEPAFAAPQVTGADIELEFELTVTNHQGCPDTDTVVITVTDRDPEPHPCSGVVCDDDGQFCNGVETCDAGICVSSGDPCLPAETCDEDNDACIDCLIDSNCDDGLFCTGVETCVDGACVEGTNPCDPDTEVIDFETLPSGTPTVDDQDIFSQYEVDFGVKFTLLDRANGDFSGYPRIAKVGLPGSAFLGCADEDTPLAGQGVGQSFLTGRARCDFTTTDLLIDYATPVARASGVLIDVDVHDDGYEEWTITARDSTGATLATEVLTAPSGPDNFVCVNPYAGPGDGLAVAWTFDLPDSEIRSVLFRFTGTSGEACIALDNFSPATASAPPSLCDEDSDVCLGCLIDSDCDDGVFCNGVEVCVDGECQGGESPCGDHESCDDEAKQCKDVFTDDFNDGYLHPCHWIPTFGEGVTITEGGGMVSLSSVDGAYAEISTVYDFEGDLDAYVDFDLVQFDPVYACNACLVVRSTDPGINYVEIKRWRSDSQNVYAFVKSVNGAYSEPAAPVATSDVSGKFRISRSGNQFTAYYWSWAFEDWQPIGSTGHFGGTAQISLDAHGGGDNPTVSVKYDNLSVFADDITGDCNDGEECNPETGECEPIDCTPVTTRIIDGVTVDISTAGGIEMTARTYNVDECTAFWGVDTEFNAPLNPENVSGTRFISSATAVPDSGLVFPDAQPIIFEFGAPVTLFGLTTLDLLEDGETCNPGGASLTLRAYDALNVIVDEHTRVGGQGPGGLDLDWFVSGNQIAKVELTGGSFGDCNGYGIDDLVVTASPAVDDLEDIGPVGMDR